jgi:drug/metabolite transporter (DMT)-like permease
VAGLVRRASMAGAEIGHLPVSAGDARGADRVGSGGMVFTVVFALAAAFSNGANVITQHAASIGAPKREKGLHLVRYLFRQPLWLLGWVAAVSGFVFQAVALRDGKLSVVQPLLVTELVFVLLMRRMWFRQDITRAAWIAAAVVCVTLGVFLSVAEPSGGQSNPETAEWLSALLAFGGAVALLTAAGMRGSPLRRTIVFALAGALAWAMMAVFLKATTDTLAMFGVLGALSRWPVYALAVAAISGTLLEQAALHAGPLSVSQPLLIVVNPLASIVLSVWLFEEHFTRSPARLVIAVVSFAVMAVGIVELSRRAPQNMAPSRPAATEAASS